MTAHVKQRGITAVRLEVLTDPSLPGKGPGRAPGGNFVLNEFASRRRSLADPTKVQKIGFGRAEADFSQQGFAVQQAVDNNPATGWAINPQLGKDHTAIFELQAPIDLPEGAVLTFTLDQQFNGKEHNIGKFRLSVTTKRCRCRCRARPRRSSRRWPCPPRSARPSRRRPWRTPSGVSIPELGRLQGELARFPKPTDKRLLGAQDLAWALLISKEFLFNH